MTRYQLAKLVGCSWDRVNFWVKEEVTPNKFYRALLAKALDTEIENINFKK